MSCKTIGLFNRLENADEGGSWEHAGYSVNFPATPGSGGSPVPTLVGDKPSVDFDGFIPGFYHFRYKGGEGVCEDDQILIIHVLQSGSAGEGATVQYCEGSNFTINLNDHLTGNDNFGIWGINENSPDDPAGNFTGSNLNLYGLEVGVYIFDYTITLDNRTNFDPSDCIDCHSIATVVIEIIEACEAGEGGTYAIDDDNEFNLFDLLTGIPDQGGEWTQISGIETVTITGGHLGTISGMRSRQGCEYRFRYTCSGACPDNYSDIIIDKSALLNISIDNDNNTLTANVTGCVGTLTYQWQYLSGINWINISGAAGPIYTPSILGRFYRVVITCNGCVKNSDQIYLDVDCDCNVTGLGFEVDPDTDCITAYRTGVACSPPISDVILMRINGGTWINTEQLCGCSYYHYLDVNPTCTVVSGNFRFGYNNPQRCGGQIIRAIADWADGTRTVQPGSDIISTYFQISKSELISRGRTMDLTVRLRVSADTYVHQTIRFNYTGDGSSGSNCNDVTVTKVNIPRFYKQIEARRNVVFGDGCPNAVFEDVFDGNLCENIFADVFYATQSGCANNLTLVVYNCNSYTIQWYKNDVPISGATGNNLCLDSHGEGEFYAVVTGCGCAAVSRSIIVQGCSTELTVQQTTGQTRLATFTGCVGNRTWEWQRFIGGVWVTQQTTTNSSNTNSYTPTTSGEWRVRVTCLSNNCQNIENFTVAIPCTIDVYLDQIGTELYASIVGCTGSKNYFFYRWNGTTWVLMHQGTSTSSFYPWAPATTGLYKVIIQCVNNNCVDEAQTEFLPPCDVTVSLSQVAGTYTATVSGCSGARTFTWQRWNGTTWANVRANTTGSNTDSYSPVNFGLHRVIVLCHSSNCSDTVNFTYECNVSVNITTSGVNLIANAIGCVGAITYTWYKRNTPGTGSWGSPISSSQTINTNTHGAGEYRVVVLCGGCTAEATRVVSGCTIAVTVDCGSTPFTANVTGCSSTVYYQWQYSPINSGWTNLGTSSTQIPVMGTGYYRVIVFCGAPGICPAQSQSCYYEDCTPAATISRVGCVFTLNLVGCTGTPVFQWQYRATPSSPWVLMQTNGNTYTNCNNGEYRVTGSCGGCLFTSNIIEVGCPSCTASLTYLAFPHTAQLNITGCEGYTWQWIGFGSPGSNVVVQNGGTTFNPTFEWCSGRFYVRLMKEGCPDIYAWYYGDDPIGDMIQLNCV